MCEPQAPPAESSSHMRPLRSKAVRSPLPSRAGPGERLLQFGETESEWCDARCWLWWKGPIRENPGAPSLQAEVREAEWSSQHAPGLRGQERPEGLECWGRWPGGRGGQGLQFFKEEASGGLVSGRVEGVHGSRVRRRIPPVWWASGRPLRWLVSAPPRSSCLRPSSSYGTA